MRWGFAIIVNFVEWCVLTVMTKVLLVDDDVELVEMLKEYLEQEDFDVTVAHDGEAGVSEALSGQYALAVLDVMMPLMTGFEVLAALKTDEKTRNIPILMVTAQSKENEVLKGLELGADDYITKPFSPNELAARVKNILMRRKRGT